MLNISKDKTGVGFYPLSKLAKLSKGLFKITIGLE